jgi:beta-phosphoglucomutase-like phosphatase (HAD superfamily)
MEGLRQRIKGVVLDVGGVIRDSEKAVHACFCQAFAAVGRPLPPFSSSSLYHLRGLESFNSVLQATKALYVTQGQGLDQILDEEESETKLNKLVAEIRETDLPLLVRISDEYQRLFALGKWQDNLSPLISFVFSRLHKGFDYSL